MNKNIFLRLILSIIVLIFSITTIYSQYQLPNGGFETFETGFNGIGQQPTSWKGSNVSMTSPARVTQVLINSDNNGRSGNCVYLHNEEAGAMGITKPAPAYIALGTPWTHVEGMSSDNSIGGTTGGISFSHRPDTISVWIKRSYSSSESARIVVYFWGGSSFGTAYRNRGGSCQSAGANRSDEEIDIRSRNSCTTTQQASYIGNGEWESTQQYSSWTQIKVPITYFSNSMPEKMNLIISSANYPQEGAQNSYRQGSKLWADDASFIYSSKIHDLRISNRPINNFNPNTLTYTVTLGQGATTIPTITAFRSGRQLGQASSLSSEISIVNGTVDGNPTTITVNAEDGSSSTTYTINFVSQQSSNSRPSNILIGGNPIPNFNGYVTSYNYDLPYNTTTCPQIEVQKAEATQTYNVQCTAVPGVATVTVYAQNTTISSIYTINLGVLPLSDNTLKNILINGVGIPNFTPTNNNYNIVLPLGTATAPTITPISAYPQGEQTINVTSNSLASGATITVSAAGSPSTRTYRIGYTLAASSNSHLSDIKIGGASIPSFAPNVLRYNHSLPRGTTSLPPITWTVSEASQTAVLTTNGVNGESRITVTAQDGSVSIYKINFSVEKSTNSHLSDILINGVSIPNFNPDTTTYSIILPSGTTSMPTITYTKGDVAQNVRVTAGNINDATTIRVTAEDINYVTTYTLNIEVEMSANSTLNNILIDGLPLANFSPTVFNYNYTISTSATQCPQIEAVKASAGQRVFIAKPQIRGTATIEVYPETNGSGNVYTINFSLVKSNNNLLSDIKINGSSITNFNSNTLSYIVDLPHNSTAPQVEYTKAEVSSSVSWINGGLQGSKLIVTAEDGTQKIYEIKYQMPINSEAKLAGIMLYNKDTRAFDNISGFDENTFAYQVVLPWGTKNVPAIHPVGKDISQKIKINYGLLNDTTTIEVKAEDGTLSQYKIKFMVEKSSSTSLFSIRINGSEIDNFLPNTRNYQVLLPYNTNRVPNISFIKGIVNGDTIHQQKIVVSSKSLKDTTKIIVVAEDGSIGSYHISYKIDMSSYINKNHLNNILINGIPVAGYNYQTENYSVALPYGTEQKPDISYIKSYKEQSVLIDYAGLYGQTKITVKPNIEGVAEKVYYINFSVSDIPQIKIDSIFANGVAIGGFTPKHFKYVLPVATTPTITYKFDSNALFVVKTSNHKYIELKVSDINDPNKSNTYTLYFYYTNDIIPNGSFESWAPTRHNNKQKPTGWMAPADTVKSMSCFFSYTTGNEVTSNTAKKTDGTFSCYLASKYESQSTSWMPGLITTGKFTSSGACSGTRKSSVAGGIDFKNTPDSVLMDYMLVKNNSGNMLFTLQLWNTGTDYSSAESVSSLTHTDNQLSTNWRTMAKAIEYSGNNIYPQRLNIVINASKSNNSGDLWGSSGSLSDLSQMYVDNLRFKYSSELANIKIDGEDIAGFSPNTTTYNISLPSNYSSRPHITAIGKVLDQEHIISLTDEVARQRTAKILVKAEDGSQTIYTINLTRNIDTIADIKGILVNGVMLNNFSANRTTYNDTISNLNTMPDILVIKDNSYQSIIYSSTNNRIEIKVTAENGETKTYSINFFERKDGNALLSSISVEGNNIAFAPNTTDYMITLPAASKELPNILVEKQNNQIVLITYNGVNDTTFVKVTSSDNTTTNSYKLIFSSNGRQTTKLLSQILADGAIIDNFQNNIFTYQIQHNGQKPKISFVREFFEDQRITEEFVKDTILIEVEGEKRYKLAFGLPLSGNAQLSDIKVNGVGIASFSPSVYDYNFVWNSPNLPDLQIIPDNKKQNISLNWQNNKALIRVTAENLSAQNEYSVSFNSGVLSNNSKLSNIFIDGIGIASFDPQTLSYTVLLPAGTTQMPLITAIGGEEHQTIRITLNGLNNTNLIKVTAQDGTYTTYSITINVTRSDNALLRSILINGTEVQGFNSNLFNYSYILPYGTTSLPSVEWTKGDAGQTVTSTNQGVRGNYVIKVTSESGNVTNNYTITFSIAPSNNAFLSDIKVNSASLTSFDSERFEYSVSLPYGTTQVPAIEYISADTTQTVVLINAASLNDTAKIVVTAGNGTNRNTYKISFNIMLSNNAYLSDIFINNEPLRINGINHKSNINFARGEYWYNISMPYNTTQAPAITWRGEVADYKSITITQNGALADTINATIKVISQDESNTNEYFLNIFNAKSDYSLLSDLKIKGVTIEGFAPANLNYSITHPVHSDKSVLIATSDVSYTKGEANQKVEISEVQDNTLIVKVTAQDGVSSSIYVITQKIKLSDNALLKDILIENVSLKEFEPNKFDYTYILPFGTVKVPEFTYTKGEEQQKVVITRGFAKEKSYIYVTAEDGKTESTYSILFSVSDKNPGEYPSKEDVCFSHYDNNTWKATTRRHNVEVLIYNPQGYLVFRGRVPLSDPNDDLCRSSIGQIINLNVKGVYIFSFVYNKKKVIYSDKFINQ